MVTVQDVKDTFYLGLRDGIAARNAGRTTVIRGQVRPAVLVLENELPGANADGLAPLDTFCLRWTELVMDTRGPVSLMAARCEIRYATEGTTGASGTDRGRALAAMDAELAAAVDAEPRSLAGVTAASVGGVGTTSPTGSRVFWGDLKFGPTVIRAERLERVVELEVYGYGE